MTARPALTKKLAQGQRSREEILDAAERLMSTKGYAGTSISTLAAESGLPASSIYWHFASKQGVIAAVMERGAARFFTERAGHLRASGVEPGDRLHAMFGEGSRRVLDHPQFVRLYLLLLLGRDGGHDQDQVVSRVRERGRTAIHEGLVATYRPWGESLALRIGEELADVALALFDGLFIAVEADPDIPRDRMLEQMTTTVHLMAQAIRDAPGRTR